MGIDRVWAAEGRQANRSGWTFLFCERAGRGVFRRGKGAKGAKKGTGGFAFSVQFGE
mgnify:CR=1 FL=1